MAKKSNFIELKANPGYVLMDASKREIFNKVTCNINQVDKFVQVRKAEAEKLHAKYVESLQKKDEK